MNNPTVRTEANRQYAAAYEAHYSDGDLPLAFKFYTMLIASHPHSDEAGYSKTQINNMVNTVVPKQELLAAQTELILAHFAKT
jgi:hypothetical protein